MGPWPKRFRRRPIRFRDLRAAGARYRSDLRSLVDDALRTISRGFVSPANATLAPVRAFRRGLMARA